MGITARGWTKILGYWLLGCWFVWALTAGQADALYTPIPNEAPLSLPCPTDGTPCRIMIAGDSIALGNTVVNGVAVPTGGVRPLIDALLAQNGKQPVQWVGRFPDAWGATSAAAGYWVADTAEPGNGTFPGVQEFFPADVITYQPHIVVLYVGTNNAKYIPGWGTNAAEAIEELDALVQSIATAVWFDAAGQPHTPLIVMSSLVPLSPSLGDRVTGAITYLMNEQDAFGRMANQLWGKYRNSWRWNVLWWDAESAWIACQSPPPHGQNLCHYTGGPADPCGCWDGTAPGLYSDWIHPNASAGYFNIGTSLYGLLTQQWPIGAVLQ